MQKLRDLRITIRSFFKQAGIEMQGFIAFLFFVYTRKKIVAFSIAFEKNKNRLVKFFIMKRGRYNRPFLHLTTMGVLGLGVLVAPLLADTYPIFAASTSPLQDLQAGETGDQSIFVGEDVFQTQRSEKPRDKIVTYKAQKGDTISTIAKKFGISTETIKWENNLTSDSLAIDDELKILPVSGVSHKVSNGETVYSIAKKYDTEPQKIVDFPFNDFANPETFALVSGQIIVVPDGIPPLPSGRPVIRRQVFIASGPVSISGAGYTWPLHGGISQFPAWYHMALDITSPVGTPVVAAQNGTVSYVNVGTWDGGYGTNIQVCNGSYCSLYAHMSGVNVGIGDAVAVGKTVIGWVGLTGRTTGAHLHFEVRKDGASVNPLPFLQ